jgi:hypothetical protein
MVINDKENGVLCVFSAPPRVQLTAMPDELVLPSVTLNYRIVG